MVALKTELTTEANNNFGGFRKNIAEVMELQSKFALTKLKFRP